MDIILFFEVKFNKDGFGTMTIWLNSMFGSILHVPLLDSKPSKMTVVLLS